MVTEYIEIMSNLRVIKCYRLAVHDYKLVSALMSN